MTECDLTDEDLAKVMGWSAKSVAKIRNNYVDNAAVVVSLAERVRAKHSSAESWKMTGNLERAKGIEPSS